VKRRVTRSILGKVLFVYRTRGIQTTCRTVIREIIGLTLKSVFSIQFVKTKIFDFHLLLDLEDAGISRALWLFGKRELDHKWIMEKTVKSGTTVLDIGANIGYYALIENGLIGRGGKIIAVEPSPDNVQLLKKNIELNKLENVEVVEGAVSDIKGVKTFWLAQESNLNSFHPEGLQRAGNLKKSIEVQVHTVQDLVKQYGEVDYLRMDVEGHEVQILNDIVRLARSGRRCPDIIFETHINTYDETTQNIGATIQELADVGYFAKYVASSSANGTRILERLGSRPIKKLSTDEVQRTIHENLPTSDLIHCLTNSGGIRTVFLARRV
jgi:FkbM family methyltransferase